MFVLFPIRIKAKLYSEIVKVKGRKCQYARQVDGYEQTFIIIKV